MGTFESVATIYGGSKADEVWLSVNRQVATAESPYWETAKAYVVGDFVSVSNEPYAGPHSAAVPDRTTYKCLIAHTSAAFGNDLVAEKWVQENIPMAPVRFIERFDPNFRPTLEAEAKENYWYLDCAYRTQGVDGAKLSQMTQLGLP